MRLPGTRLPAGLAALAVTVLVTAGPAQAGLGELVPVSLTADGTAFGDNASFVPVIPSADGRFVAFRSTASNLVPGQTGPLSGAGIFMRDLATGRTVLVSHKAGDPAEKRAAAGIVFSVSADGRYVAFTSQETDLVSGFSGPPGIVQVYLFDRTDSSIALVSRAAGSATTGANGSSFGPAISADGRFVAYSSPASDLVAGQVDPDPADTDVFLYDVAAGTNTLVSHSTGDQLTGAAGTSVNARISDDGGRVGFESTADDLTGGADPASRSIYVFERTDGTNRRVSRNVASPADSAGGESSGSFISGDGKWVVFNSTAQNLVTGFADNNGASGDVYLAAVDADTTLLASHGPAGPASGASGICFAADLGGDGAIAAFVTNASDLIPGQVDAGTDNDVFTFDRSTGAVTLLSSVPSAPRIAGSGESVLGSISRDGRLIAFQSVATDLVLGQQDGNGDYDVFVRDTATGVTRLLSAAAGTTSKTANASSTSPSISDDGRTVAFQGMASDLVAAPLDGNSSLDVFAARNRAPLASATVAPASGPAPLTVSLDGSASSDADGQIQSHEWDHGDGTTSTGPVSSHTYAVPGTYTVALTVRDDEGATATATQVLTVGDARAPRIRRFAVVPNAFAPLLRGPAIPTARKRGTTVRYRLSEAASVRFTVQKRTTGRRVGRRCVKRTSRNAKRRRCRRYVKVRGNFTHAGVAGANRFRFSGRLRNRALARASYRLVARATDAAGNRSAVKRAAFRIVKR